MIFHKIGFPNMFKILAGIYQQNNPRYQRVLTYRFMFRCKLHQGYICRNVFIKSSADGLVIVYAGDAI